MLTLIGICPQAAIRDCSETAKAITQGDCAQEQGPLVDPSFCAAVGSMPIKTLAAQILAFCVPAIWRGRDRWLHPGSEPIGRAQVPGNGAWVLAGLDDLGKLAGVSARRDFLGLQG